MTGGETDKVSPGVSGAETIHKVVQGRRKKGWADGGWRGLGGTRSEQRIVGAAPLQPIAELLKVRYAIEVDEGSSHHQDVEDLVGLELEMRVGRERGKCECVEKYRTFLVS